MSDVALGATATVFLWTYAAVSPLAGFFGDRMSRARLLTFSLASWSLVMACSALVQSTGQLLFMRALLGVAEAAYIPAATALIADHHGPDTRGKAIGIHLAGFSVGMVGGGSLAGYLGEHFGWRPSFAFLGLAGLVLTGACVLWLRDAPSSAAARAAEPPLSLRQTIAQLLAIPTFLILTLENVLSGTVNWVFINWLPLFFRETFALSLTMAGFYGTLWIQAGRVAGVTAGGIPRWDGICECTAAVVRVSSAEAPVHRVWLYEHGQLLRRRSRCDDRGCAEEFLRSGERICEPGGYSGLCSTDSADHLHDRAAKGRGATRSGHRSCRVSRG